MTRVEPYPPLALVVALAAIACLSGCAGTRLDPVEARNTANEMRRDLNDVAAELNALAPTMQALCASPSPELVEWCGDADRLWGAAQRAISAAHLGIDAYDAGGVAIEHVLTAIDAAEDGCDKLIRAIEAARAMVQP